MFVLQQKMHGFVTNRLTEHCNKQLFTTVWNLCIQQ